MLLPVHRAGLPNSYFDAELTCDGAFPNCVSPHKK